MLLFTAAAAYHILSCSAIVVLQPCFVNGDSYKKAAIMQIFSDLFNRRETRTQGISEHSMLLLNKIFHTYMDRWIPGLTFVVSALFYYAINAISKQFNSRAGKVFAFPVASLAAFVFNRIMVHRIINQVVKEEVQGKEIALFRHLHHQLMEAQFLIGWKRIWEAIFGFPVVEYIQKHAPLHVGNTL